MNSRARWREFLVWWEGYKLRCLIITGKPSVWEIDKKIRELKGAEMRRIKFRVWDKEFKSMSYNPICDGGDLNSQFRKPEESRTVIMQFTGLKDKKGKEIYEGDIVKIITIKGYGVDGIGKVVYTPPSFEIAIYRKIGEYYFRNDLKSEFSWSDMGASGIGKYEYEVIGNYYENPELLKEGQ